MKKIFAALLLIVSFAPFVSAQTPFTAPWGFNYSAPTGAPSALGTRVRFDITTGRIYTWSPDALNWQLQGYTIDQISGTSAPAYAPVRGQSWFAVNGDTLPRLYQYTGIGTIWKCLNCSDGKTYTAGTGIGIAGTVISNTGDLSNTNELQTIDTFSVSGSIVSLSLSNDAQPAKTITLPASGITALTGDVTATGPGSAAATIANGAVNGAKLATNSVDSTKVIARSIAGSDIALATIAGVNIQTNTIDSTRLRPLSIPNSDIANVAPNKLLQSGASMGQFLGWNGSIWGPTAPPNDWALLGNAATAGSSFLGTTNLTSLRFRTNNVQRLILDSLGNFGVGVNVPLARMHVAGSDLLGATSGFLVSNSGGSKLFDIRNSGLIRFGNQPNGAALYPADMSTGGGTSNLSGLSLEYAISSPSPPSAAFSYTGNFTHTSGGAFSVIRNGAVFQPSSGSVAFNYFAVENGFINQTGGANGIVRGFYFNPTITSAPNLRAIETIVGDSRFGSTSGSVGIGVATGTALAARLQVVGSGSTSATWTAQFHNSTGTNNALRINDDGTVYMEGRLKFGGINTQASVYGSGTLNQESLNIISGLSPGTAGSDITMSNGQGDPTITTSTRSIINCQRGFAPTSGTGEYRMVNMQPVINQTGGASGPSIGFLAAPTLTSAASWRSFEYRNNTGWGIYGVGTAPSHFGGDIRIGTTSASATNLTMVRPLTGATTVFASNLIATIQSDVLQGIGYSSAMATQAATFSTTIRHFYAQQSTFGAGSTVTQQSGFFASGSLIGATENYGFHGVIPSGAGRWNLFMSGTADNALAGSTIIGASTAPAARLHVQGSGSTSSTWTAQFHNSTGTNNALLIRDDGALGFGTSTLNDRFNFRFDQNAITVLRNTNTSSGTGAATAIVTGVAGQAFGMFAYPSTYTVNAARTGRGIFDTDSGLSNGMLFSTSAGPIEFAPGTNKLMTLTTAGNLMVGSSASPSARLHVQGAGATSATFTAQFHNSTGTNNALVVRDDGRVGIGTSAPTHQITMFNNANSSAFRLTPSMANNGGFFMRSGAISDGEFSAGYEVVSGAKTARSTEGAGINFYQGGTYFINRSGLTIDATFTNNYAALLSNTGNFGIGTNISPSARLHVVGADATSSNTALLVQNSTPSDLITVRNDGKVSYWATNTATGTTGAQTIDRPSGTVNIAAGQSSIVVTNSLVTTASLVFPVIRTNDATATIKNVVPAAGSFTITLTAAATAETSVGFFVIN